MCRRARARERRSPSLVNQSYRWSRIKGGRTSAASPPRSVVSPAQDQLMTEGVKIGLKGAPVDDLVLLDTITEDAIIANLKQNFVRTILWVGL